MRMTMNKLLLLTAPDADQDVVAELTGKIDCRCITEASELEEEDLYLYLEGSGLSLNQKGMKMRGDFSQMLPRLKQGRLQGEMLVKAAKLKGLTGQPVAIDATAGMGEDSLLLAAAGYKVYLFEKDPVIAALLWDTLRRAKETPALASVAERMILTEGDSIAAMKEGRLKPDLIYLDPMFPARSKSGLIKKKFQLLQQLEQPCSEEEELVKAALMAKPKRIVIKRPAKGPYLAGIKPSYSIDGKAIRYDCLVP